MMQEPLSLATLTVHELESLRRELSSDLRAIGWELRERAEVEHARLHRGVYADLVAKMEEMSAAGQERVSWSSMLNVVPRDGVSELDRQDQLDQLRRESERNLGFSGR